MPSSRRAAKKKRRSQQAHRYAAPTQKPRDNMNLGGRIMWLPKLAELSTPSGLPDACHDHPVILLSPKPLPSGEVVILMITSFGNQDLLIRHNHDRDRRKRAHYLPIAPSPSHPDDPDKNVVLKLADSAVLRKNSWVNTETQYRVVFSLLRNYEWRTGKLFVLLPESYERLVEFVGFRDDEVEVVAGPSVVGVSQRADAEPDVPLTQTATPPLTPELGHAVVPEVVQVPVVRLPQVDDRETAQDSDSDATIVAGDDWESYRTRSQQSRDQVLRHPSAIARGGNHLHEANLTALNAAHQTSYTTSNYGQGRQQAYYPASQIVSVPLGRSELPRAMPQAHNERTSLLHPQPQAWITSEHQQPRPGATPHGQRQATTPTTVTNYGTLPSSSRPSPTRGRSYPTPIATEITNLHIRARLTDAIITLHRKRPKHTWSSQLSLPFRFDFIFFGTASPAARARARDFSREVAVLRSRAGSSWFDRTSEAARFLRGWGAQGWGTSRHMQGRWEYEGMMTRAQARDVERGIWREIEDETERVARLAPCGQDREREGKGGHVQGRMSMVAMGVLVFVILLVQATVLAGVVCSVVYYGVDEAVVEWVAKAAGNVVDAFWAFVEFCEWVLALVFGLLVLLFVFGSLAICCCGG